MSSLLNRIFGNKDRTLERESSIKDDDPDIDFEDDKDDDISYLGELVHQGTPSIYVANGREFSNHTRNWAFNREMNEEHIQKLKFDIEQSKNPSFIGTFKIAIDTQRRIRLMDGQHRHEVLRRIISSNVKFNMDIILEVYNVSDVNEGIDTFLLFDKCNTVLSIKEKDIPKKIYAFIVSNLTKEFPMSIKSKNPETGREPNYPNLSEQRMYRELSLSNIVEKFNISERDLLNMIKEKNLLLSNKNYNEIFTHKQTDKEIERCKNALVKCRKSGFYLGLQIGINKKLQWIYELYNDLCKIGLDKSEI